jgi:hypothetical protein
MLLLLDDEAGIPAGAGTLYYVLGGAVLVELALRGRVEIDESGRSGPVDPTVLAVGDGPLGDPLLQSAHDTIAERPRRVQTHLVTLGADLWKTIFDRLVERGLLRREKKRTLGVFRTTRLLPDDARHEAELREKVRAVLEDSTQPDARTAAIIALISANGALPAIRPALAPWSGPVYTRAKELENGHWGAAAVGTAVTRTAAAIAASTSVAVVTAVTATP